MSKCYKKVYKCFPNFLGRLQVQFFLGSATDKEGRGSFLFFLRVAIGNGDRVIFSGGSVTLIEAMLFC